MNVAVITIDPQSPYLLRSAFNSSGMHLTYLEQLNSSRLSLSQVLRCKAVFIEYHSFEHNAIQTLMERIRDSVPEFLIIVSMSQDPDLKESVLVESLDPNFTFNDGLSVKSVKKIRQAITIQVRYQRKIERSNVRSALDVVFKQDQSLEDKTMLVAMLNYLESKEANTAYHYAVDTHPVSLVDKRHLRYYLKSGGSQLEKIANALLSISPHDPQAHASLAIESDAILSPKQRLQSLQIAHLGNRDCSDIYLSYACESLSSQGASALSKLISRETILSDHLFVFFEAAVLALSSNSRLTKSDLIIRYHDFFNRWFRSHRALMPFRTTLDLFSQFYAHIWYLSRPAVHPKRKRRCAEFIDRIDRERYKGVDLVIDILSLRAYALIGDEIKVDALFEQLESQEVPASLNPLIRHSLIASTAFKKSAIDNRKLLLSPKRSGSAA